jgi:hypothetical protein
VGLAGVLDDGETVPFGDDRDLVEVGRQPVDVYRDDGARARANEPPHVPGVERVGVRTDIGEDRHGQRMQDRHRRG